MTTIRPEVTGRAPKTVAEILKLPKLSALDLERHVSVTEAAAFKNISKWTFRRRYRHLIRRVSPNRDAVKIRDLLSEDAA